MKFNLKKSSIFASVLSVLTFGTITEAEAKFIGRVYTENEPWEYNGSRNGRQIRETRYYQVKKLEITSEFDDPIRITNIILNRGNCPWDFRYAQTTLKWGQFKKWQTPKDCNIREVTIETDRGSYTLRWN